MDAAYALTSDGCAPALRRRAEEPAEKARRRALPDYAAEGSGMDAEAPRCAVLSNGTYCLATGVSEQQVQVQTQYYTDPKYVILSLAVTAVLAILGCMISNKLIVKHFRKSGAIK